MRPVVEELASVIEAKLERGRCLIGVARTTGNDAAAAEASEIFRSLGAHDLAGEAAAAAA